LEILSLNLNSKGTHTIETPAGCHFSQEFAFHDYDYDFCGLSKKLTELKLTSPTFRADYTKIYKHRLHYYRCRW